MARLVWSGWGPLVSQDRVTGAVKVGARVGELQCPSTGEEEGARRAEGAAAEEKGTAGEAEGAAVCWGWRDGVR